MVTFVFILFGSLGLVFIIVKLSLREGRHFRHSMTNSASRELRVGPEVDLKQKVEPTAFTAERIASLMHGSDARWDKLVAEHSLAKVDVQQIAIGYLSFVARISFHFDGEREPFPVILKVRKSVTGVSNTSAARITYANDHISMNVLFGCVFPALLVAVMN